jgi:hypothetical protein
MKEIKKITDVNLDYLLEHAKANAHVDWLKENANKTKRVKDEEGKEVEKPISFVELRNAYCKEFIPELATRKKKPKKNSTFIDKINAL